jgi:N-succinyldiaminopimelate aminotransferase
MHDLLPSRLASLQPTIFGEMTRLAHLHGAVNLGQGYPEGGEPRELLEMASWALAHGQNQYPPARGVPRLRQAIAAHQRRFWEQEVDPETEVLVTMGATEGIAASLIASVGSGDEVILLEPAYDAYAALVTIAGAAPVPVRLLGEGFALEPDTLARAITARTRALILNNPANPTGKVFSEEELEAIAEVAIRHELLVLSDEVYEHLVFAGSHRPIATLPGMQERTLTISSAAKSFSVTGWKIGWVIGPATLVDRVSAVKQYLTYAGGTPLQIAVAYALERTEDLVTPIRTALDERRRHLACGLSRLGFSVRPSHASYFLTSDLGPLPLASDAEAARMLVAQARVATIPLSSFVSGPPPEVGLRWTFAKEPTTLDEALNRLGAYLSMTATREGAS